MHTDAEYNRKVGLWFLEEVSTYQWDKLICEMCDNEIEDIGVYIVLNDYWVHKSCIESVRA